MAVPVRRYHVLLRFSLCVIAAACAPTAAPPTTPPPTVPAGQAETGVPTDVIEPPPAAVRTADRLELSGSELGTMWTFENPPIEYWQSTYGFTATPEWLQHVRLASVRYGEICSASFVSPNGLVMTNHHCARDCIEAVSTATNDYVVEGFYAPTREDELLCPGLYLDQLIEIEAVTDRVQTAAPAGAGDREVAAARDAEQEEIEEECEAVSDYECQVVSLFEGGQFQLYRYRRIAPVKLVFAPELQAGFFGGDPDNFTYPRYALDVSFVRAYEPDSVTVAQTPEYFEWDADGAQEGELVFITGNPGSTSRYATVAELMYEARLNHPFIIQLLEGQRDILQDIAARGPEAERQVRDNLFSIENALKSYGGQLAGLRDTLLVGRKVLWEQEFRERVEADATLAAEYGEVWDEIATLQARKVQVQPRLQLNDVELIGSPYVVLAGMLVRYLRESAQPEAERPDDLRGPALAQLEQQLLSPTQLDPGIGAQLLELRLGLARAWLPADAPLIQQAFRAGESPEEAADRLIQGTRVADADFRRALLSAGAAALDTVSDPLLQLVRQMEQRHEELAPLWEEITTSEAVQQANLAEALFAVYGTDLPPDATFTLRITDGVVQGYPYNGTIAPPKTTFYGLYERSANFDNTMPWQLPESFADRQEVIDMAVPLNFVTTNDITGGNSGSPMINREAQIVGVAFDSNIEALPNEFLFAAPAGRTVGVHSAGIIEALRSVYQAEALVEEIVGTAVAQR